MSNPAPVDKRRVVALVLASAQQAAQTAVRAQRASAAGVTHEESRAESDKDTRATEASYLARGQAARVDELRDTVNVLASFDGQELPPGTPARVGALVLVEENDEQCLWLLATLGAGIEVEVDGSRVSVVSTRSPLGRALLGCRSGEAVSVPTPRGERELSLLGVW